MREIRDDVRRWLGEGSAVALAQVTKTWGSSPRVPGSVMAVAGDGRMTGSVSGGCIEGAVAQVAMECAEGRLSSLEKFHASTRRAQEVGLSCGGNIEVFVSRLDPELFALEDALLAADADYVRVTAVEAAAGDTDGGGRDDAAHAQAAAPVGPDSSAASPDGALGGGVADGPASDCEDDPAPSPGALAAEIGPGPVGTSFLVAEVAVLHDAMEKLPADAVAALQVVPVGESPFALATLEGVDSAAVAPEAAVALTVAPTGEGRVLAALDGTGAAALVAVAAAVAARPRTESTGHVIEDGIDWFFARVAAKPQLVCIGGVHIAMRLCEVARALGWRTVVVDPRRVFATGERFPAVDELVHGWPQEVLGPDGPVRLTATTAVCALTHDPKIDVPALKLALDSPAFYIGSLGRSTTQWARARALAEEGVPDEDIARVYGPIGLDLRGREPAEIALSIMAEITAVRHGSPYALSTMLESARKVDAEKGR